MAITSGRVIQVNVAKLYSAEHDHIAAPQLVPTHLLCIDRYAIAAVQVFDNCTCGCTDNARMHAADKSRFDAHVVTCPPTYRSDSLLQRDFHIAFGSNSYQQSVLVRGPQSVAAGIANVAALLVHRDCLRALLFIIRVLTRQLGHRFPGPGKGAGRLAKIVR